MELPGAAFGFFHDFLATKNYYILLESPSAWAGLAGWGLVWLGGGVSSTLLLHPCRRRRRPPTSHPAWSLPPTPCTLQCPWTCG